MPENRLLVRAALLLALVVVFQSVPMLLPLPPFVLIFIIGSLVNATMFIAVKSVNLKTALIISCVVPIIAFLQGKLPIVPFILVVALGNSLYVILLNVLANYNKYFMIVAAALGKTLMLAIGTWLVLSIVILPPPLAKAVSFAMSWPQMVTSTIGGFLGLMLLQRLGLNKT